MEYQIHVIDINSKVLYDSSLSFKKADEYLKSLIPFLNIGINDNTQVRVDETGLFRKVYRANVNDEVPPSMQEIRTIKERLNELGFDSRVFRLEEIV